MARVMHIDFLLRLAGSAQHREERGMTVRASRFFKIYVRSMGESDLTGAVRTAGKNNIGQLDLADAPRDVRRSCLVSCFGGIPECQAAESEPAGRHCQYGGNGKHHDSRARERTAQHRDDRESRDLRRIKPRLVRGENGQEFHRQAKENEAGSDDHSRDGKLGPTREVAAHLAFQPCRTHVQAVHYDTEYDHAGNHEQTELVVAHFGEQEQQQRGNHSYEDFKQKEPAFVRRLEDERKDSPPSKVKELEHQVEARATPMILPSCDSRCISIRFPKAR